ncbi:MAG: tyrosine-protein phosphatase [Bacilli bacterium]|nr:tyrosine-protein phosphatase [Bacilli bacterium]
MKHRSIIALATLLFGLTACVNKENPKEELVMAEMSVIHETKFDSVYGDLTIEGFMSKGFEFGDSVSVSFSTGYSFDDVPFYDGYYVKTGAPLVIGYPGYPYIDFATNNKANCFQNLELKEGDKMTITLNEKGKYLVEQETFSTKYSDNRSDYSTNEVFANFRPMEVSTMKSNLFYRGASPVDNQHSRASYANRLIEEAGIKFVLNLADNQEEMDSYIASEDFNSQYALNLYREGNIALLDMGVDFTSSVFQEKLATGLTELVKHDGPYYIHCTEGKDRTGFVCYLLETLSGASYEELENDYMITYDNYYGINKAESKSKYDAIVDLRFKDFINLLTPTHDGSFLGDRGPSTKLFSSSKSSLAEAAKEYLIQGGMTEENVDKLVEIIKK